MAKSSSPLPCSARNASSDACRAVDRGAVNTTSSAAFLASHAASRSMGPGSVSRSRTGSNAHSTSERSAADKYPVSRMSSTLMYSGLTKRRLVGR